MGDGDKTPLRLQFNPKVRLSFTVPPSLPMPDSCPFESWMMPWALPILLPTISRKAAPVATSDTTWSRCSASPSQLRGVGFTAGAVNRAVSSHPWVDQRDAGRAEPRGPGERGSAPPG